jgi:hypothetical protein
MRYKNGQVPSHLGGMGGKQESMSIDLYVAIVDTSILALLLVWSWMDRNNVYFSDGKGKK